MIVTHPSHIICYNETRFQLTHQGNRTNTNIERTLRASEGDTCEVLSSRYECNCTDVVGSKATGEPLPLMLILQGPVPVADKDQWPRIDGFPTLLYSNDCRRNYGAIIIKYYYRVFKTWLQTINVSAISESKELIIFYGCPLHINIDLLKELRGDGTVVLLRMTNTSHDTNVEDLVNFSITKI